MIKQFFFIIALVAFLTVGVLSIVLREKVYASRKSENPMGKVNGMTTLSIIGGVGGFFLAVHIGGTGWDLVTFLFLFGWVIAIGGALVGNFIAYLPPIKRAFTINPFLYYIPTVLFACVTVLLLFWMLDRWQV